VSRVERDELLKSRDGERQLADLQRGGRSVVERRRVVGMNRKIARVPLLGFTTIRLI
jgi:hypothetical protein